MKLRTMLVVCCVLLFQAAPFAQSGDPVSGNWGSDGATFLELKFDGKRGVSGTTIWRGNGQERRTPIKTGTFDAKTRALKLEGEGERPDGVKGSYVIEGVIDGETVSGTFTFVGANGNFRFTRQKETTARRTKEQIEASYEKHKGDFDYLLGDWEFTSEDKEYGKGRGYWSAVRLDEGQILDEYRVVGDKGETYYVTTSLRNYNKALERWELIGADAGTGLQDFGTARRVGAEMHIEQKFGVMSGTPSVWKIRYYNIRPDGFSWAADRSTDGGKTWVKNHLQIEARRIGPARSLGALAPARNTDPISGTWTGYMGRGESDKIPISVALKLDGNVVTGTITGPPHPGDIKTGTFDVATGALKLEIVVRDAGKTRVVFEGTVKQGTAQGSVSMNQQTGAFTMTRKAGGS